jgi:hypothetical protein
MKEMPLNSIKTQLSILILAAAACSTGLNALAQSNDDWLVNTISPVANPIYFEDPKVDTEIRPVFLEHRLPETYHFAGGTAPLGGDVKVFAVQARLKLTDRLALIATKDGYIESTPDHTLPHTYGWGDIGVGAKYVAIDDPEHAFILTPGLTLDIPIGSTSVFQGHGAGFWNLFAATEKGWDQLHVTGNLGFFLPNNTAQQTFEAHYSAQVDYYVSPYFIPFISGNAYTVLNEANNKLLGAVNLNTEFNDLSDFGSSKAAGTTQFVPGIGFRSRLWKNVDIGFAYEYGLTHPQGIFKDRFTTDLIWRF